MTEPTERRRNKRYEIRLQGRIGPPDGGQESCLVLDYCSGGLLLQRLQTESGEPPATYQTSETLQLNTEILNSKGSRKIRINGTVAWVSSEHFGLSFAKASDVVFEALRLHDSLAHADLLIEPGRRTGGEARCLAKLRHVAQGALPHLLREMLVMTGEALLGRAENVSSNTERQQVYEDVNAIDHLREGDSLARAVLSAAFDSAPARTKETEPVTGELCLVDPDDFERWLEASRVASMLDRRFSNRLNAIGSRLACLCGSMPPVTLAVPFEPNHFTGALKNLAKELELGSITRSVLFDCAARVLGEKLGRFYSKIDAALDAMGAPVAKLSSQNAAQRSARPDPGQARIDGSPQETVASPDMDQAAATFTNIVPIATAAGHASAVAVDPELSKTVIARETRRRRVLARELMTLVSDVPNMTGSLAAWMEQLGELLACEAAADRHFFQNRQHPLREIINGLGHLQMFRANPDLDAENDPVRRQVTEILRPISRGETDESVLRAAAQALADLTSDQSRLYQRNVERVVTASEGRDRVRRARQAVSAEIRRRYTGHQVPEVVLELLEVGWRAVLELAAINAVEGDERYGAHLGLLDSVISVLDGEPFELQPSEPDRSRLFKGIKKELANVAFDPFRRNAVETRLRAELVGPDHGTVRLVEMPLPDDISEEADTAKPPGGLSNEVWARLLERCAMVTVGARIRFLGESGGHGELRVAWIRADRAVFTLVDYRGLRVRDIGQSELALDLHQRRIEVERADGQPLSDRAVDAILLRMEERLAHQAAHDSLTGLINRQQFSAAVEKTLAMPGRPEGSGVLLWLDVDQFRLVNDIHGYETGDRLLVAVARLLEGIKGVKVLGHLGGDRFALMLPDISRAAGGQRADDICELVGNMPFEWSGPGIAISASIGVVGMGAAWDGPNKLLQAADTALAAAKAAGGDRSYVYREDDPEIARRKESVHWLVQVDEALDRGQLRLRCQPIVPVRQNDGLAPHYEVLLGVHSGAEKPLPIAEFIDAAERYNRMRAVDRWVARTVMEWIAAHREHMPALHGFAVNLSGQTASDPSFVDFAREQFHRTGIEPSWLSFEVTETAAVADLSASAGIIRDLKSLGCKVALDDFGSGLASYSYLKELPVDWLKIDGVFVRKIAASREDLAVVKSINEIGHFLGKKTIAEYVEDDKILRLVSAIGVDYAQGYGISPPLLMDDLIQTIETATG